MREIVDSVLDWADQWLGEPETGIVLAAVVAAILGAVLWLVWA